MVKLRLTEFVAAESKVVEPALVELMVADLKVAAADLVEIGGVDPTRVDVKAVNMVLLVKFVALGMRLVVALSCKCYSTRDEVCLRIHCTEEASLLKQSPKKTDLGGYEDCCNWISRSELSQKLR